MVNTELKITITGRVPSKKNSTISFVRNGRMFHMPSNQYRDWHKDASKQIMSMGKVWPELPIKRADITMWFYWPDRRKADISNKTESIMDLLVDNGILEDDNWEIVPFLNLYSGGIDKNNPRVEVSISKLL